MVPMDELKSRDFNATKETCIYMLINDKIMFDRYLISALIQQKHCKD